MKISPQIYKLNKNKNYIKTNALFFIYNGINIKSNKWLLTEQNLKNYNFNYYKIFNKTTFVTLKQSIYHKLSYSLLSSLVLFIKPEFKNKKLNKKNLLNKLNSLNFILISINLNNKVYSIVIFKKMTSLNYFSNKLIFYNFLVTSLKITHNKLQISK